MAAIFSNKAARRIVNAVKKVENAPTNAAYRPDMRSPAPLIPQVWAVITEEVSDGGWDSPGVGKAQIQTFDGEDLGPEVDVVNRFGGGVIPEEQGVALAWIGGVWQVALVGCSAPEEE